MITSSVLAKHGLTKHRVMIIGRASGGLLIFYNSKYFNSEAIRIDEIFITARIKQKSFNFILIFVYFQPYYDMDNFLSKLKNNLKLISDTLPDWPVVIGGDFNGHMDNLNEYSRITTQF